MNNNELDKIDRAIRAALVVLILTAYCWALAGSVAAGGLP